MAYVWLAVFGLGAIVGAVSFSVRLESPEEVLERLEERCEPTEGYYSALIKDKNGVGCLILPKRGVKELRIFYF